MEIITIPALSDNYMYLLADKHSKKCFAIDPVEPVKIIEAVKQNGFDLTSIITTHHHSDHSGGNAELVKKLNDMGKKDFKVYGGDNRIDAITDVVTDGNEIKVGDKLNIRCLFTPCHTSGHICYYVTGDSNEPGVVFTGDTLFLGGCGRFFEGTAQQMYTALVEILGKLPNSTRVYCGHEYTAKNLEFALTVEPDNDFIKRRLEYVKNLRSGGQFSVPGTIEEELATNPFMRVTQPTVLSHAKTNDPIEAMQIIRKEKDHF